MKPEDVWELTPRDDKCVVCEGMLDFADNRHRKYCSSECSKALPTMKKYNISIHGYRKLKGINKCAICGDDKRLVIDHNHETGVVRGILCSRCNTLEGVLALEGGHELIAKILLNQSPLQRSLCSARYSVLI